MLNNNQFQGNDFQYGQSRVKTLMFAAVACVILSLICGNFSVALETALLVATLAIIVWTFVVIFRYCKCPHCGHTIVLGVLQATSCPVCRRSLTSGKKVKKSK